MNKPLAIILMLMSVFSFGCRSQSNDDNPRAGDRLPAVAGQFYEADSMALIRNLTSLFAGAAPCRHKNIAAVISPHAGFVFSGSVAADGFNQLDPDHRYRNIFIIGSSHRNAFNGASVYCNGDFFTPLGRVTVDTALGRKLVREHSVFTASAEVHMNEHCIEVQLPFLQYRLKKNFTIVPVLIGTDEISDIKKIAAALKPYFTDENLFVISTDLSHYPAYSDAVTTDKLTTEAMLSNSPDKLLATLNSNSELKIPGLVTSLCSWTSVLTLLFITEKSGDIMTTQVGYKNSGDAAVGDTSRVVGYSSVIFSRQEAIVTGQVLSPPDKEILLDIARKTITSYITDHKLPAQDTSHYSPALMEHCGAFVTLKIKGELRGCIGRFTASGPLYLTIRDMAIAASTQDPRFTPVTTAELKNIDIEISVLSPLQKIKSIDEIELGRHGIYIVKGSSTGTFLPQVATETGWNKEQFLGHCAQDKAGIGWYGWKDADIYIYTADVFEEK